MRHVSVPPGVVVLGVAVADPAGVTLSTETNCRLFGKTSVRSKLVIVWPAAMSAVTVYRLT
jgi:hypothetical protein